MHLQRRRQAACELDELGVEKWGPDLEAELVEFASRLAPSLKVHGLSLKRVLKRAVSDLLPKEILGRRKRGFGVPLDRWFREDLRGYVADMLGKHARVRDRLNGGALDQML